MGMESAVDALDYGHWSAPGGPLPWALQRGINHLARHDHALRDRLLGGHSTNLGDHAAFPLHRRRSVLQHRNLSIKPGEVLLPTDIVG